MFLQKVFKMLPCRIISAAFVTLAYLFFVHHKISSVKKAESENFEIEVENINTVYDVIKKG